MKKRLLALLVACAMIVSLLPVQVLAYDGAEAPAQTQAEEADPAQPEAVDEVEAEEDKSEADEDKSEDDADKSESDEDKSEDNADKSEDDADKSESDEDKPEDNADKSEAEEDKSEADEDKSEENADKSEPEVPDASEPEVPDASEPEVPEEAEPQAEEGEESVNPQEAEAEPEGEAEEGVSPQAGEVDFNTVMGNITITVDPITRFKNDRFLDDNSETWWLDCWPGEGNLTITYDDNAGTNKTWKLVEEQADGDSFTDWDEMRNAVSDYFKNTLSIYGVDFGWMSDEEDDDEDKWGDWGVGVHQAKICLGVGDIYNSTNENVVRLTYNVTVIDVEELSVECISRSTLDRENGEHGPWVVNCWPDRKGDKVTLKVRKPDGVGTTTQEFKGNIDEIQEALDESFDNLRHDWDWYTPEDEGRDRWLPGNGEPYEAQLMLSFPGRREKNIIDHQTEIPVTVLSPFDDGNPAVVEPFSIFETDLNFMEEDPDDPNDDWYRLNCDPRMDNSVKVWLRPTDDEGNFVEGNPIEVDGCDEDNDWNGNRWSVQRQLNDEDGYNLDVDLWWETWEEKDNNVHENGWPAGNDNHTITARLVAHMWQGDYDIPLCEYEVTVIPNVVTDVRVGDNNEIWRLDSDRYREEYWEDGHFAYDWNKLDCYPEEVTVWTTLQDDPFTGDMDDVRNALSYALESDYDNVSVDVDWHSDEEQDKTAKDHGDWWPGDHTATLTVCGFEKNYTVHVLGQDDVFASVDATINDRFESDRCEDPESDWDEENNKMFQWYRLDCWPDTLKVTLTAGEGGTVYDSEAVEDDEDQERLYDGIDDMVWQIENDLRQKYPGIRVKMDWDSDEEPVKNAGEWEKRGSYRAVEQSGSYKDYTATVTVGGKSDTVSFKVLPTPALTVDVDDIWRLEGDRDWYDGEFVINGERDWVGFDRIYCEPFHLTVSESGNTIAVGDFDQVRETLESRYPNTRIRLEWGSDEEPKKVPDGDDWEGDWTKGDHENGAWVNVMGTKTHFTVHVIEPSDVFTAATVDDITRMETDRRFDSWWDDEWEWQQVNCYPDEATITVGTQHFKLSDYHNLNDGDDRDPLRAMSDAIEDALQAKKPGLRIDLDWCSDEEPRADDPYYGNWEAGKHNAWIVAFNQKLGENIGGYTVYVLNNPVVDADINDVTMEWDNRNGGGELNAPPTNGKITLHLDETIDGLTSTQVSGYYNGNLEENLKNALTNTDYDGFEFEFHWYTDDFEEDRWTHGTYTAVMTIDGKEFFYDVHVTNTDHRLSPVAAVKATCTAAGNIAYYLCEACHKYFEDAAGKLEIFDIEDPAKGHTLTHTAAKAAQVGVAGNIEYWHCTECGKYYKDAGATQEITQAQTVIAALPQPQPEPEPQPQPQPQPPARTALTAANVSVAAEAYVYDGAAKTPVVTVTSGGKTLTEGTDYTLSYADNVNAGTAKVTVTGVGSYEGTAVQTFAIAKADAVITAQDLVKPAGKTVKYKLSAKAPGALSFKSKNKKVLTVDSKGNVKLAKAKTMCTAKVVITSAETVNYKAASKTVTVMIGPAGVKLNSAKTGKAKKTIDVSWAKGKKGVTGYQVQYALDKQFTSGVKTAKVKGLKSAKTTLKKLKSGKKYFIRVRAVQGNFYSPWSGVKNTKAK